MKKVIAIIEKGEDGTYRVYSPELENVIIGSGDNVAEAKEDFENSYNEMVECYVDEKRSIPEELKDIEFIYQYDLSVGRELAGTILVK